VIKDNAKMNYTVFINPDRSWLDLIEYRVWCLENVGKDQSLWKEWEIEIVSNNLYTAQYVVNFKNIEDATAFKLRFKV